MITKKFALPDCWKVFSLSEIAESIQYGFTDSAKENQVGPKFLRITDIQNGNVDWNSVPYCEIKDKDIRKYLLTPGDILFARTGATTGKSFLIKNCPEAVFASYLIRIRLSKVVKPEFCYYYFQSPRYWSQIMIEKKGSAQPGVNATILSELKIPVPPIEEQTIIVSKIEELFSRLDAGVAGLKRAQAELKRYRASVLKAAFEGRLVPQDLDDGSYSGFIYEDKVKITEIEKIENLPETWVRIELGDLLEEIYRYPTFYGMEHLEKGIPVIRVGHIKDNGKISHDWKDYWYISNKVSKNFPRTVMKYQDIVMGVRGSVGKIGLIDDELIGAQMSPNCIRLSVNRNIAFPLYIFNYLRSHLGQRYFSSEANSTTIKTIKASSISSMPINLPNIHEQKKIVSEIEARLSIISNLNQIIESQLKRISRLKATILHDIFTGKLI